MLHVNVSEYYCTNVSYYIKSRRINFIVTFGQSLSLENKFFFGEQVESLNSHGKTHNGVHANEQRSVIMFDISSYSLAQKYAL